MVKIFTSKKADYEKKYKTMRLMFIISLFLCGFIVYSNYDYILFKILIAGNYIYTDALDTLYDEKLGTSKSEGYFKNFDNVVIAVFSERLNDRYTYLYTPEQYNYQKEYTKEEASHAALEQLSLETAYLLLPNISKYTREFVYENRSEIKNYSNIVIDLRGNGGGELADLYKICDLFLEKGMAISSETARLGLFSKHITSKDSQYFTFDKIIILQDRYTASAAEGFIMALSENLDNVTIIGTQSFGKGIGQITIPVKYGFAVKATVIKILTPNNNSIHLSGITPDIIYDGDDIGSVIREILNIK